jgi:hypothetical protein
MAVLGARATSVPSELGNVKSKRGPPVGVQA